MMQFLLIGTIEISNSSYLGSCREAPKVLEEKKNWKVPVELQESMEARRIRL